MATELLPTPDYRALFETAPGLYLVLTPQLQIVAVSDAYLRATMTDRDAILGRELFDVFPDNPDDPTADGVANLRQSLQRVVRTRVQDSMAVQKYDIRRPESEGGGFEERFWSPVNCPVLDADGGLRYIIHRVEDVTALIRLKEQGAEQSRLAEELRSRTAQMELEIYRRAQELQTANELVRDLNSELEQRVELRTVELRKVEERLLHSQKMEAIGRLAGSIAHDFNNLLSVILSYSSLVIADLKPVDPMRADVEQIRKASERAADLTRQLLAFSRQQVMEPQIVDLSLILEGMEGMLQRLLGEDVVLNTVKGNELWHVKVDPSQVEQVIMNLAINARDAMPEGGKLTIETRNVDIDEAYASEHFGAKPGPHVMVAVSDNGAGMDKQTQTRIFEPFFSTKPKGKGTGLGLSTVFGIVQQSGGNIWVYSEAGKGTTFRVYLPRTLDQHVTQHVSQMAAPAPVVLHGTETVLLAEDEDQVRDVASGVLQRYGYHVLEARNAGEALLTCEAHPGTIHLLLTDVVMPQMSGRQLAERLAKVRPEMTVLFMSGYTENAIVHHGILDSGISYLQKPFTPETLVRRVRQVIDSRKR